MHHGAVGQLCDQLVQQVDLFLLGGARAFGEVDDRDPHQMRAAACPVTVHCPKPVTLVAAESRVQLARFLLARRGMLTSSFSEAIVFVRSDPALIAPPIWNSFGFRCRSWMRA